jgi:transcriptional regulator with XRE-family HTH domain
MDNLFSERLAEAIKPLRQGAFAEKVGVGRTQFNRYATGRRKPPADLLVKIARESGRSVDWLLGVDTEPPPNAHTDPPGDDLAESDPEHGSSPQKPLEGLISKSEIEQFLAFSPDTRRAIICFGEIMEAKRAAPTDVNT